jgi:hypothetical protein
MTRLLFILGSIGLPILTLGSPSAHAVPRLQSGNYFAEGSMFASSSTTVAHQADRSCIQFDSGPPRPYADYVTVTVSSISYHNGNAMLDGDQSLLQIKSPREFERSRGLWQLNKRSTGPISSDLKSCLEARGIYSKKTQGAFVAGMVIDRNQAKLIDKNPTEKINVRQSPGTNSKILHYGLVGDRVTLTSADVDRTGAVWYFVKFEVSGATGWVHSRLIQRLN